MKRSFNKRNPFRYDVWKLVNRELFASTQELEHPVQLISDIDKTYIESTYDSLKDMAKIALENASEKTTVKGAREFFRALKWHPNSQLINKGISPPLHFVSSSPPQLRKVLEHKIALDRLLCASNCFKDQIYNLTRGKISLLKHQVSYKMAALLSLIASLKNPQTILLFGDDAESDPYVYTLIKGICDGSINTNEATQCLHSLGVTHTIAKHIFSPFEHYPKMKVHIFIRKILSTTTYDNQENLSKISLESKKHLQKSTDGDASKTKPSPHTSTQLQNSQNTMEKHISWFVQYSHLALLFYHKGFLSEEGLCEFASRYYQQNSVQEEELLGSWLAFCHICKRSKTPYPFISEWLKPYSQAKREAIASQRYWQLENLFAKPNEKTGDAFVQAFQIWTQKRKATLRPHLSQTTSHGE